MPVYTLFIVYSKKQSTDSQFIRSHYLVFFC